MIFDVTFTASVYENENVYMNLLELHDKPFWRIAPAFYFCSFKTCNIFNSNHNKGFPRKIYFYSQYAYLAFVFNGDLLVRYTCGNKCHELENNMMNRFIVFF